MSLVPTKDGTYIQRAPWLVLPQLIPAYQPDKVLATGVDQGIFYKRYLKIIFIIFECRGS
jgi:hypothetical protein